VHAVDPEALADLVRDTAGRPARPTRVLV